MLYYYFLKIVIRVFLVWFCVLFHLPEHFVTFHVHPVLVFCSAVTVTCAQVFCFCRLPLLLPPPFAALQGHSISPHSPGDPGADRACAHRSSAPRHVLISEALSPFSAVAVSPQVRGASVSRELLNMTGPQAVDLLGGVLSAHCFWSPKSWGAGR